MFDVDRPSCQNKKRLKSQFVLNQSVNVTLNFAYVSCRILGDTPPQQAQKAKFQKRHGAYSLSVGSCANEECESERSCRRHSCVYTLGFTHWPLCAFALGASCQDQCKTKSNKKSDGQFANACIGTAAISWHWCSEYQEGEGARERRRGGRQRGRGASG